MMKIYLLVIFFSVFICKIIPYAETKENYYVLIKSGLSLRKKPSINSKKIGTLKYNSQIKIIKETEKISTFEEIEDNWVEINYKGKKGYIFSGYLSRVKGPNYNIRSLKKYADSTFKRVGKSKFGSKCSDDYCYDHRIYKYSGNIVYIKYYPLKFSKDQLTISGISHREAFLIMRNLDSRFSKFVYSKNDGLRCRYQENDDCTKYGECFEIKVESDNLVSIIIEGECS